MNFFSIPLFAITSHAESGAHFSPVIDLWVHEAIPASIGACVTLRSNVLEGIARAEAPAFAFGFRRATVGKFGGLNDHIDGIGSKARAHFNEARFDEISSSACLYLDASAKRNHAGFEDLKPFLRRNIDDIELVAKFPEAIAHGHPIKLGERHMQMAQAEGAHFIE